MSDSPRGRRLPPWPLVALVAALLIGAAAVRAADLVGDRAVENIVVWTAALLAALALAAWFFFRSGYRRRTRAIAAGLGLVGLMAFFALFRVQRISGELVPKFTYRFASKPDRALAAPEASGEPTDLNATGPDDFPQFLGPQRNAALEGVGLDRDWAARPPQLNWRQPIGAGWSAFSVVNGFAVTMEQRGDDELVACYEVGTGRVRWSFANRARYEALSGGDGPRCTPTIDEGRVYALGAKGDLLCLDGSNGRLVWRKNLLAEYAIPEAEESADLGHGRVHSPLVLGELVIVPAGGPRGRRTSLVAYDKRTGDRVWEGGQRQPSYSSPAFARLADVEQALIVAEDAVCGHDPRTGAVLWEHPWEGHSTARPNVAQPVVVGPDRLLVSKGYGQGAMLLELARGSSGALEARETWRRPTLLRTKFTSPTFYQGHAFGLSDGILECIEVEAGRRVWKEGRYKQGQLLRADDLLLILGESGEMVLVEATPDRVNHVLGRFQAIEGMTWNNVALSGPHLLVRNSEEAACYRLELRR